MYVYTFKHNFIVIFYQFHDHLRIFKDLCYFLQYVIQIIQSYIALSTIC